MSDTATPITDENVSLVEIGNTTFQMVLASIARKLERENTELKEENRKLLKLTEHLARKLKL
jgi:hypothetical protein